MYREAIFYGTAENREKVFIICWLLPYMQRYIYKMHRDTYISCFQQNEIMKLRNLQVVVVDKLFHKYVLKGLEGSSKKRFKCHCLLQVGIYCSILPLSSFFCLVYNFLIKLYKVFLKKRCSIPNWPLDVNHFD